MPGVFSLSLQRVVMDKIEKLKPFPPNSNPFRHDAWNMGQAMGKDLHIMFANHASEDCKYLILVQESTGKRVRINIPQVFED